MIIVFFFPSSSINYSSPSKSYFIFFASFDCMEKDFQVSNKMRSGRGGVRDNRVYTALVLSWRMAWQRWWKGWRLWEGPVCLLGSTFHRRDFKSSSYKLQIVSTVSWNLARSISFSCYFSAIISLHPDSTLHFHISACLMCNSRRHFMLLAKKWHITVTHTREFFLYFSNLNWI